MSATSQKKIRLVSTARHIYAGRLLHIGDEFDATLQDAEDLIALHFALPALPVKEPEVPRAQPLGEALAMTTQDAEPLMLPKPKPKRVYRRRDMKAED